jgi:hypothetical protein
VTGPKLHLAVRRHLMSRRSGMAARAARLCKDPKGRFYSWSKCCYDRTLQTLKCREHSLSLLSCFLTAPSAFQCRMRAATAEWNKSSWTY